jgi:hypothetical protein
MNNKGQIRGVYNDVTAKYKEYRKNSHMNKSLNDSDGALTDKSHGQG